MSDPFVGVETLWAELESQLDPIGHELTRRAYPLAVEAHIGQMRQEGTPYVVHPLRVALLLAGRGWRDDELLAAALLHDVVEDSAVTREGIAAQFGEAVADWVQVLTKPAKAERQHDWEDHYYAAIEAAPLQARLIKCADRLDNLRLIAFRGAEKATSYRVETRERVLPIAAITDATFYNELEHLSHEPEHQQ
jgi:guanosine-3',5'-bis(diphosphate) 3'-pyrophosphohydrolase